MNIITMEEVEKHNEVNDCWVACNGLVYDVTSYINRHPGGKYVIKSKAGKEVTKFFEMHSKKAKEKWKNFIIGTLHQQKSTCCI